MKDIIIVGLLVYIVVSHVGAAAAFTWLKSEFDKLKADLKK